MKRVVVGISGGVDSSVAAYLLKEQGYEVIGAFMRNYHDTEGLLEGDCPQDDDRIIAELVAKKLDIPFHYIDLSVEYKKKIIDYMFAEYEKGRTPNPDVLCNREIKFDVFVKAVEHLNAHFVATGHYCQKGEIEIPNGKQFQLLKGADPNKDQSYFLCQLSQNQLSKILFPIGHLLKPKVREIAKELNLPTAERKDSQGICFVGKVDLPTFLQQQLKPKEGIVIEFPAKDKFLVSTKNIDNLSQEELEILAKPQPLTEMKGYFAGKHNGAHFYTIGQRKGLNIGGKEKPLYVVGMDIEKNVLYVGQGDDHPLLHRQALAIDAMEMHWIRPDLKLKNGEKKAFSFRIRYRQPLQQGILYTFEKKSFIVFNEPQKSITPGQFAAWYQGNELIGSGVISE